MATSQKRVLIVEDERPLAHALELKLQHEGFLTKTAENGQIGLDLILTGEFDIVLLDVMMPVLDGFKVLEGIQEMDKKPTIFTLSNLSQPVDEERMKALGSKKYFVKSNTPLATIVEEVKKV